MRLFFFTLIVFIFINVFLACSSTDYKRGCEEALYKEYVDNGTVINEDKPEFILIVKQNLRYYCEELNKRRNRDSL